MFLFFLRISVDVKLIQAFYAQDALEVDDVDVLRAMGVAGFGSTKGQVSLGKFAKLRGSLVWKPSMPGRIYSSRFVTQVNM